MYLSAFLAFIPLLFVLILLLKFKMAIDVAGGIGLLTSVVLALFYFHTDFIVIPSILFSGFIGSLPVSLVIGGSIIQITLMAESGALASICSFIKTLAPKDQAVQVLLINVAMGVALTGLGAATVAIFPPLLLALGYSVSASILLPALGYVAFCLYALLGIPAIMVAAFSGQPLYETGITLATFMPLVSTCIAFSCLHVAGGFKLMRQGFIPALLTGLGSGFTVLALAYMELITVSAFILGFVVMLLLFAYVKFSGSPLRDASVLNEKEVNALKNMSLVRASSPWIFLIIFALLANAPIFPLFDLIFNTYSMPVEIIPNHPERLRIFWQAYFWVFVSTCIALPFLRMTGTKLTGAFNKGFQRAWRPFLATSVFFCIAYMMNHSGTQANWAVNIDDNMIYVLAHSATTGLGALYPAAVPFLGILAGIIGGSASSSVAMLSKFQVIAAESLNASPVLFASASAIGGGLASAIAPSKLMGAAASIDKTNEATSVMPYAFALTFVATLACSMIVIFLM